MEQSGTADCWVQARVETGTGATRGVQTGKGRLAGLVAQFLRYEYLSSLHLLLAKGRGLANDHR